MSPDTVIEELERDRLPLVAKELCGQGYRLVQMMGTPREDTIEVLISFDKAAAEAPARMEQLRQAEFRLMRDMPAIPLYYYVSRHLVRPGLDGFVDNVRDIHLSRYLELKNP